MTDTLVYRVRSNLKAQSYHVNDSWLKECIEYYISENTDASLSAVQAFVISQWLLSDLREINNENGSLPANFSRHDKIVLPAKYIIQVDKMCDISQSKYSQIQKIRNVSEANIKATAIEAPAWEPKGKRMIQMHLTDGIQDFTAIEYKPIKALKDTLLPGFKLMIIGPVMCRKGVIMLKEENYREIGGEVDSLLKVNALENVLARALGMEENENPYADENQESNANQTDNEFPDDEFDINLDEITQIERLSMEGTESPVNRTPNTDVQNPRNDHIPNTRTDQVSASNSSRKTAGNEYNKPRNETGNNVQRKSQVQIIEDFNDLYYGDFSRSNNRDPSPLLEQKIVPKAQLTTTISLSSSYQLQDNCVDKFKNRRMEDVRDKNSVNDFKKYSDIPTTSKASTAVFPEDDCFDLDDFKEELNEDTFRTHNPMHIKTDSATAKNSSKVLPKPVAEVKREIDAGMKKTPLMTSKTASPGGKSPTLSAGKRSADMLSPLGNSPKVICLETKPQLQHKKNRKITEFTEKIIPKEDMPPKICDFICDVIKETAVGSVTYKTVRGKVTQIGRLLKKDKHWDLKATITDGTASLEIMFTSQVLEELIGFTVPEFLEKRKSRKTNPEVEEYLRGGFRNAEIRVQRMDALMELELSAENEIPKVVNTRVLTEEHKQLIEKRMKMMAV